MFKVIFSNKACSILFNKLDIVKNTCLFNETNCDYKFLSTNLTTLLTQTFYIIINKNLQVKFLPTS